MMSATAWAEPHWGEFKKGLCTAVGKRQHSAILWGIKGSWEEACKKTPAIINGQNFAGPTRCKNEKVSMWGEFDVDDTECMPTWGSFKKDDCRGPGIRQKSSVLHDIKDLSWEAACEQMPATIDGFAFVRPSRCKNVKINEWGEFDVPDNTCLSSTACAADCKAKKVNAVLGAPKGVTASKSMYCNDGPFDPYGGKKARRQDLGLPDSDNTVHIDMGGEAVYQNEEGQTFGGNDAINLNCSLNKTSDGNLGKKIPNLVFGFGNNMPFADAFADRISVENAPIFPKEIERVIKPGGVVKLVYTDFSLGQVDTLAKDLCVTPTVQKMGVIDVAWFVVPSDFDYRKPRDCKSVKEEL
ncbi:hypothetical protein D7V88_28725 [Corallococcus terminator]|uniref:Methyltransferase domain-containing protein n=1 Tax=Corallococcus terminator TaxID=2316733 RepID=A0A3A8IPU1_9BACT|nr:hypothetical protein D7V88_28725 [Corallococcus terminator]